MPHRMQRQRHKGWRLSPNTVCVSRPSRWGNPFVIGKEGDRAPILARFAEDARRRPAEEPDWLEPLRGKDLACSAHVTTS
jgi:hypothetical protein